MNKITILSIIFLMFSCNDSVVEKPKNLIDDDTMIDIMYDIAIIEAIKIGEPNSLTEKNIDTKNFVFKKYKIDSAQLAQSDKYYATDIRKYARMYQIVIDRVKAEKKKDSLAKIGKKV